MNVDVGDLDPQKTKQALDVLYQVSQQAHVPAQTHAQAQAAYKYLDDLYKKYSGQLKVSSDAEIADIEAEG